MKFKRNPIVMISILLGSLTAYPAWGENMLLNIPVYGTDPNPIKNVVTVAKSGGDFASPIAAMSSIRDASENNQYVVVIGPGVFHLNTQLVIKDYVSIIGSGREVTKLSGSNVSDLMRVSSNATLSDMTLENLEYKSLGSPARSRGIYIGCNSGCNKTVSPTIERVTVKVSNANDGGYGIVTEYADPIFKDISVEVNASFSYWSTGMAFFHANALVSNASIKVNDDRQTISSIHYKEGIAVSNGSLDLNNSNIKVAGGTRYAWGMRMRNAWEPTDYSVNARLNNVSVYVSGGYAQGIMLDPEKVSVQIENTFIQSSYKGITEVTTPASQPSTVAIISNSSIYSDYASIDWQHASVTGYGLKISNSKIKGKILSGTDSIKCRDVYDVNLNNVTCGAS